MDPRIGAALVTGIGSLGSSLFNTFIGQKQSKDLMDYQYELQQKAIDAQNLYNSPAEQMKRLAAAGLNPNLVYGSGVDGNQSSAASPSIASRHGQMGNVLGDAYQAYNQQQNLQADTAVKQEQAASLRVGVNEAKSRIKLNDAKALGVLLDNEYLNETMTPRVKAASQALANSIAKEYKTYADIRNAEQYWHVLDKQVSLLAEKEHLTKEQAATEIIKRNLYQSGIALNDAKAAEAYAMVDYLGKGGKLRDLAYNSQMTEYEAKKAYQEWRAKHPKTSITFDLFKEVLGIGKQATGMVSDVVPGL